MGQHGVRARGGSTVWHWCEVRRAGRWADLLLTASATLEDVRHDRGHMPAQRSCRQRLPRHHGLAGGLVPPTSGRILLRHPERPAGALGRQLAAGRKETPTELLLALGELAAARSQHSRRVVALRCRHERGLHLPQLLIFTLSRQLVVAKAALDGRAFFSPCVRATLRPP